MTSDEPLLPRPRPHHEALPPTGAGHRSPATTPTAGASASGAGLEQHLVRGVPGTAESVGRVLEEPDDALRLLLGIVGRELSGPPALWFVLLDADDRVLPVVLPLRRAPTIADPDVAAAVLHVLGSVLEHDAPGGSVLVGYVRRGGGDRGAFESGWSVVLRERAARTGVRIRVEVALGRDRARVLDPRW